MTCIAAIESNGHVYVGGDSAISWGGSTINGRQPKAWVRRGACWALAGSLRVDAIVRGVDVEAYRGGDPWRWLRHVATQLGDELAESGVEEPGFDLLLGVGGRAFSMASDLGFHDTSTGYMAGGTGCDFALGAMAALPPTMAPRARLRRALEAAALHSTTVCGPFTIVRA